MRRFDKKWARGQGLAPLAAALVLAGCAGEYGEPINGQRALSPEEQRLQAVENKTVDLSRRLSAMESAQAGTAGDDLRQLHGQVEQLQHDVAQLQQGEQQKDADFDARLKRLEAGAQPPPTADAGGAPVGGVVSPPGVQVPAAGATAPPSAMSPPAVAVASPPAADASAATAGPSSAADEEAIYLKSFDQLRAGKYDSAIAGFRSMVSKYPQGNYADNAWYWMGESYHVKGQDADALKSYQSLLQGFPASPKVPDALLKIGAIYQTQQKTTEARDSYSRLLKQYPNSSAASQARVRLAQLH
jgi:tol-pal system protein YbgF